MDLMELTCGRCRNSPASRLVVVDLPRQTRNRMLRCVPCSVTDMEDAARLGWPAWQFGLIPVDEAAVPAGKES